MTRNFQIYLLLVLFVMAGCSGKKEFRVNGRIKDSDKKYILLKRVEVNIPVLIDSARINRNGSFRFRVKASEPDFYQLGYSDSDYITILAEPGEKASLTFAGRHLYEDYEVAGSPGTLKIKTLDSALTVTKLKMDSLKSAYQKSLNEPDSKQKEEDINAEYLKLLNGQRMFNIEFILKNLRSFASIKAIYQRIDEATYVLYNPRDLQFMKLVSDTLIHYYPGSKNVKALRANFENELDQNMRNRINEAIKDITPEKLDPVLKDINGKTIALSSNRGKYVLLSFWSAASNDCLLENLQLKEMYKKYRALGFEIYQINLDTDEEVWKRAVRFDELQWISVREDDPLNPKNAILFNVKSLPANYLYDREGNIIASNIHGKGLEVKLAQLFNNY